jgi:hypothetical protein
MAAPNSWPLIERLGLLSTTELLDRFGIQGEERVAIEERHRPTSIPIEHATLGKAVVRDQKPMDDRGLMRALEGTEITPRDWYKMLNRNIFFWVRQERLSTLMNARAYRRERKTVLYVHTHELLRRYAANVLLAPMNTGCTKPMPHPRNAETFQPMSTYPFDECRKKKGKDAIVELAVQGGIPDIGELVFRVEDVDPLGKTRVIVER